jgi:hypothetical protein
VLSALDSKSRLTLLAESESKSALLLPNPALERKNVMVRLRRALDLKIVPAEVEHQKCMMQRSRSRYKVDIIDTVVQLRYHEINA